MESKKTGNVFTFEAHRHFSPFRSSIDPLKPKKDSGFSITELIMAIAISSTLAYLVSGVFVEQMRDLKSLQQGFSALSLVEGIERSLASKNTCKSALSSVSFPSGWSRINLPAFRSELGTFAQTGAVIDDIRTTSIVLKNLTPGGGITIKQNIAPAGSPPILTDNLLYFAEMDVNYEKVASNPTQVKGGVGLETRKFYFTVTATPAGQVNDCFSSQTKDYLREMCLRELGGIYDETKTPSCLVSKLAVADTFVTRNVLLGQIPTQTLPNGAVYKAGVATNGMVQVTNTGAVTFGDLAGTTQRSYLAKCSFANCNLGGVLGQDNLAFAGSYNASFPPANPLDPNSKRVVSLGGHVLLPGNKSRLAIGTLGLAGPALAEAAVHVRGTGDVTIESDTQSAFLLRGPGEASEGSYAVMYFGKSDLQKNNSSSHRWAVGYRKDNRPSLKDSFVIEWQPGTTNWLDYMVLNPNYNPNPGRPSGPSVMFPVKVSMNQKVDISRKLFVNSTITSTSTITGLSDASLKKDVHSLDSILGRVLALKPVRFRWKSSVNLPETENIGFIAQDFESVLPEFVETDPFSGIKGIDYPGFSAALVGALKELDDKVDKNSSSCSQSVSLLEKHLHRLKQELAEKKKRLLKQRQPSE